MSKPLIEACISSLSECIAAEKNGADQVELCSRLDLDGLTPDPSLINAALKAVNIPIKVMIRPRSGDFTYSDQDKELIKQDIASCQQLGVKHFVYGSLRDGLLDLEDILAVYQNIAANKYPVESFTIHKAIDSSTNPLGDLISLMSTFRDFPDLKLSVLSSGTAKTALEGADLLNEMVRIAGNKLEIIVAGKVTMDNLSEIQSLIPSKAYHGRKIVSLVD